MKYSHWLLIIVAPLLTMGGYWFAIDHRSGVLDWIILAVAIGVGLVGIWTAPLRRRVQIAATFAYVPAMAIGLAGSLLVFECSTGNCL